MTEIRGDSEYGGKSFNAPESLPLVEIRGVALGCRYPGSSIHSSRGPYISGPSGTSDLRHYLAACGKDEWLWLNEY